MRGIALPCLFAAVAACTTSETLETISRQPPSIRGTVTAVERAQASAQRSSIRIEERPDQSSGDDKALVSLVESTLLHERKGEELARISIDSVQTGWLAEAWFEGPVAESYPVQATASLVIVERAADPVMTALDSPEATFIPSSRSRRSPAFTARCGAPR